MNRRFNRPAINPDHSPAPGAHASRKRLEQAGLADASDAMDVQRQRAVLLEQLEKDLQLALTSREGGQRAFRDDVAELLHHAPPRQPQFSSFVALLFVVRRIVARFIRAD